MRAEAVLLATAPVIPKAPSAAKVQKICEACLIFVPAFDFFMYDFPYGFNCITNRIFREEFGGIIINDMRHFADILTLTRFVLAIVLLMLSFFGGSAEWAFVVFLVAVLTDAFDGTCARKWPFPKGKEPWYRKYAAKYDMISDVLLAAAQTLFLLLQIDIVAGMAVIGFYALCAVMELVLYGKFFGHPDNCTKNSLTQRNFPLAKKIVLTRRIMYALCLGVVNVFILFATGWPEPVKWGLFVFGCLIFVFLWFFLKQRRENISRDAVELEHKLEKKAK